ncbi:MAG TPA: hypothetical protein PKW08_11365 [Flavobacteriaceae bacterium]|nr:hypothetical protein [Flavobacteriaceae bacterium]HQU22176.1 hypothetical protein [Flavobacteriaceae bacterium]HQU66516.1 hypothetical protein [Flavobacteriaceae bacterium]HRW44474.1 hypothetical protein [Flavobacteriaceae bacterium]
MKTNQLKYKRSYRYNHVLGIYILGVTVFMTVYTTLTLMAHL